MKHKVWLAQLPVIALATYAFYIFETGRNGEVDPGSMEGRVFDSLRVLQGQFTNLKFRIRGPQPPKHKVVIVEIDSPSLEQEGRWPWHRDRTALLIDKIFEFGARTVGLDIVFSEPDQRVSPDLRLVIQALTKDIDPDAYETDMILAETIKRHADKLVLGWITENLCSGPRRQNAEACPPEVIIGEPDAWQPHFANYALDELVAPTRFDPSKSYFNHAMSFIGNIPLFTNPSQHAGYFMPQTDRDGYIRRAALFTFAKDKAMPSLALAMAKVGLKEKLRLELDEKQKAKSLRFVNSGREIPITPLGAMDINFRGPGFTFQYVRASDLMNGGSTRPDELGTFNISQDRRIASVDKAAMGEILKDAYVLVGLTALGINDYRPFPFDENVPGVEGHAAILDNLLAGDMLIEPKGTASIALLIIMTLGAVLFAFAAEKLESIPALLLYIFFLSGVTFADFKFLFAERNLNWNSSLIYLEYTAIFVFSMAIKYVLEERNKKFIRGAFSKYVAPAIVDSILKDPSKLTVGGEKRDLTIVFSDIRGFTTFSEKMDAKALAHFLNDYLGKMTDLVFEHEGTLDKYIGDAVMAFWGAPLDQPKHAANACKAAIAMQKKLAEERPRFLKDYGVDVRIGIGINSGPVNVGNMGSERIFEYTVIGDHVNLASRLEGLTKPYGSGILTTRFTMDLIQHAKEPLPAHRVLDFVKVKGKKLAVELIQVLERDIPQELIQRFDAARALYTKKQWDQAIAEFEACNQAYRQLHGEDDEPALMYVERCKEFKQSPPAADWDGSWEMTSK